MKKLLPLVVCLLLVINLQSQTTVDTTFYGDGEIRQISELAGGVANGKSIWFYPNGTKSAEFYYLNGQLEGNAYTYNFDGQIFAIEQYRIGAKWDSSWYYHPNGELQKLGIYQNDLYHGFWQHLNVHGEIIRRGSYENGMPEGYWQFMYDNGTRWMEGDFKEGKETGIWKTYRPNGTPEYEGRYLNGIKAEPWYYIKPNGKRKKISINY